MIYLTQLINMHLKLNEMVHMTSIVNHPGLSMMNNFLKNILCNLVIFCILSCFLETKRLIQITSIKIITMISKSQEIGPPQDNGSSHTSLEPLKVGS